MRPSFLPSLAGLHMRIFQFSTLLRQHHLALSEHLAHLGVEPAYLSQWFLSCFAVTCPLPMLFRIYDVIFAEGANETVMRVALALFRRNEAKMMQSQEFEEVMQLLLGRQLWDVYGCNADELVDDFTSLGGIITHTRLAELEKEFESQSNDVVGQNAGFLPDVQAAASRFLGRLWAPSQAPMSNTASRSSTLSPPGTDEKPQGSGLLSRPGGFLRRQGSKTSLGAANDSGTSSEGSGSVASTAPTEQDVQATTRDSRADSVSSRSKISLLRNTTGWSASHPLSGAGNTAPPTAAREQAELHTQIEDLLVALSGMQREQARMATMLQKEREDRSDDHRLVGSLVAKLRGRSASEKAKRRRTAPVGLAERLKTELGDISEKRRTLPAQPRCETRKTGGLEETEDTSEEESGDEEFPDLDEISQLAEQVLMRLQTHARFSASFETKAQLRSLLSRTREQLTVAETQAKDLTARVEVSESSLMAFQSENESLRSEVEELRQRVSDDFKAQTKLELQVQNMENQMRMDANGLEQSKIAKDMQPQPDSSRDVADSARRDGTGKMHRVASAPGIISPAQTGKRESVGSAQSTIQSLDSHEAEGAFAPPSLTLVTPSRATIHSPIPKPPAAPKHATSLSVPPPVSGPDSQAMFAQRTSSLATRTVIATPKHEPVSDEVLLLELVNAKTAEAQARQEMNEMRRAMQLQRRRAEERTAELELEAMNAHADAERAREESERAREEARKTREEWTDASISETPARMSTPGVSKPSTPVAEGEPVEGSVTKPEGVGGGGGGASVGGWFWSKRTTSGGRNAAGRPT